MQIHHKNAQKIISDVTLTKRTHLAEEMSHPEIFKFQDVIKIKNKIIIFL